MAQIRKLIRTVQSDLFFLKEARDALYLHGRRLLHRPHEREFYGLRFVPPGLPGVFVDVGANQGQSIESIKFMRPDASVVSFEANPGLAEKLQRRYEGRGDIRVLPYGLSDRDESRSLFVPVYRKFVYDGNASFDRDNAVALYNSDNLFRFTPSRLELREVGCTVQRLDDQGLEPLFIKIDVQGFEHRVILGGVETIRKHQPILMVECLHDHRELMELLSSIGYQEYVFDALGFRRGRSTGGAINQIVMTERRAKQMICSPRGAVSAEDGELAPRLS